jgi:hypothetical protein
MTEYEEICNGKSIEELEIELKYQLSLGYNEGDSFPSYIKDRIAELQRYKVCHDMAKQHIKENMNKIQYGIGRDYLSHWDITHALREIFQNYLDYGDYIITTRILDENLISVTISNDYKPYNLEFLRIGNSYKANENSIGKYGEGLKMAFLIFLRLDLYMSIHTKHHVIKPEWNVNEFIGETLALGIYNDDNYFGNFVTTFNCPISIYNDFIANIITAKDVLYSIEPYGDYIHKPNVTGNIYCGNLFVCKAKDLPGSYNIRPRHLPLDRDRLMPSDFDIDWVTSKINQEINKELSSIKSTIDYNNRSYKYVDHVPEKLENNYNLHHISGSKVLIDKTTKEPLKNDRVRDILLNRPKFKKELKVSERVKYQAKKKLADKKTVLTLVRNFKKDHCSSKEAIQDINVIIYKLTNKKKQ